MPNWGLLFLQLRLRLPITCRPFRPDHRFLPPVSYPVADVAGGLDAIKRIVRVVVFVNSAPDFTGQAGVANGASQLLGQVFGEHGRHARSAVGVATLPLGSAVEVELTVEV